jgi:dTDP-4-amino-4,6-dideoxygalactose transaminase
MNIPLVDLRAQQAEIADEVRSGLDEVLATCDFIGGSAVHDFERAYASAVRVNHCVGVANGTDALELALRAVGIGAGHEVIMPVNTFIATAEAVVRAGATPVFVDVDPEHLLIDTDATKAAVTAKTRAIVPVHLFGQVAPIEALAPIAEAEGIAVVEDAAQAQGASRHGVPAGGLGQVAATSFYPGKNLGAAGDAGAVTTNDDTIARAVRLLAAHGSEQKYVHEIVGFNSRLDTVQAVVLLAKLQRLSRWNELRRQAAARYDVLLDAEERVELPQTMSGNIHAWHLYVVQVAERDRVLEHLHAAGIGAGIHYPTPLHLTKAFSDLGLPAGTFPVAERAADRMVSLPMFPHITPEQQERVVDALTDALGR